MIMKKQIITVAAILIFVAAFSFIATAQTKHVSKWIVDNYWFDFTTIPVTISQLESPFYVTERNPQKHLYIDANGVIRLVLIGKKIYSANGNEIKYNDGEIDVNFSYLIPLPNNDNIVCAIGGNTLCKIDIEKNEILSVEPNIILPTFKAVHNSDCSGVWLIQTDNNSIKKQMLTSDGITKTYKTELSNDEYPKKDLWNLSWDCKYYAGCEDMVGLDKYVVYFGRFDRRTATFHQTTTHIFEGKVVRAGIFSPDNTSVYYAFCKGRTAEIVAFPIIDGNINFDQNKKICQFSIRPPITFSMYFGTDKRLYIFNKENISVVQFYDDGQYKLIENILTINTATPTLSCSSYLFDWYSDNPCSNNMPCPYIPAPVIKLE